MNIESFSNRGQHLIDERSAQRRKRENGYVQDSKEYSVLRIDKVEAMLNQVSSLDCHCGSVKVHQVKHVGLASTMTLGCKCGSRQTCTLDTDAFQCSQKGGKKFDLSRRLGAAMVEGAMGTRHVQDFITTLLRRQPPSKRLIQESEKEYAAAAQQVADKSMK